jgi:hypothetical protein
MVMEKPVFFGTSDGNTLFPALFYPDSGGFSLAGA